MGPKIAVKKTGIFFLSPKMKINEMLRQPKANTIYIYIYIMRIFFIFVSDDWFSRNHVHHPIIGIREAA